MRIQSSTSRKAHYAAMFACSVSMFLSLFEAPHAAAQSLLYDNTDHLFSGGYTGPRNIIWTGISETGDYFEAQRFKLGGHDNIASVSIPMARDLSVDATGTIRFSIWDDNGRAFPGQEVAELGVIDIDSLPRFDFPGNQGGPDPPNPLPAVTFDTPIDDLVPGEMYYVVIDYRDLSSFRFGNVLTGLGNDSAGTNRAGGELYSEVFAVPPFEDADWFSPSRLFGAHQYFQMSVTSADEPYSNIVCPVGTIYHQDFTGLGPDGQATTFLPHGWAFSDSARMSDFDGLELTEQDRILAVDTRIFDTSITDAFPAGGSLGGGTPLFNAGVPGEADRALALGVTRTTEDGMLQLVAQVAGGDAHSLQLAFDIEAWDAANSRNNPGEAAFNVALDLDTGDGFQQIMDLGQVSTGATLVPPNTDPVIGANFVNGNDDAYRTSFDSGLLGADLPEGSLLRVRWMADLEAQTTGWVFGLDNVSLGMFAEAVPSVLGDYNGNGLVEQGDLDLVLLNWGDDVSALAPEWVNQRPTEGIVDQAALDGVLLNWGSAAAAASVTAAVPEPRGVVLGLLVLTVVLVFSRRSADRRKAD